MIEDQIEKLEISLQEKEDLKNWIENYGLKEINDYLENRKICTNTEPIFTDPNVCCICGEKKSYIIDEKFYCRRHYDQIRRKGKLYPISKTTPNEIRIYDGYCSIITLDSSYNETAEFFIDDESVYKVLSYKWYTSKLGYCTTCIYGTKLLHHVLLTGTKEQPIVDHINKDTYNNLLSNLRLASCRENNINRSKPSNNSLGIIGVSKDKKAFVAYIVPIGGKRLRIGNYPTLKEATIARLNAEVKHYGKFAPQRHLYEEYGIDDSMVEYDPPYVRPIEMTLKRALELYNLL